MYRLYGSPGSGSMSVEAALSEVGASYEIIDTTTGEGRHLTEEFKAINPRQQVPALELPDGSVMTEGSAMMLHLADAFPDAGLAPPPGSAARAQHDRWLIFMAVNVYEGELRKAYADRFTDAPDNAEAVRHAADSYVKRHYEILEDAFAGPYFLGDNFSMVDIYLWMVASWMDPDWLAAHAPKIEALARSVGKRAKVQPIGAQHFG